MTVVDQVAAARRAARKLAVAPEKTKNDILLAMARRLDASRREILAANATDATAALESGLADALYKRLILNEKKISSIVASLESVVSLPDPIGTVELERELDEGLVLSQVRVPIGVIGVIFESRPDALVQIASLAIKSGNAVILKGGSEAQSTNRLMYQLLVEAIRTVAPEIEAALQLVETREGIKTVLELDGQIDLMIPRGSNQLVRYIQEHTRIPVLGHADGVCHLYIHDDADPTMAVALVKDSKTQYPAVCNALETLLIHRDAAKLLTEIVAAMPEVEFRGCRESRVIAVMEPVSMDDWSTEYNDLILSVRIVDGIEDAILHINEYGSHHTDAIVTSSSEAAERFLQEVDSSSVLWNASTRFADGFRYGLGAEVGISTGKVHARGPVGLQGMTTTQYRVRGHGDIVADFAEGRRSFTHREVSRDSK
ncbi:MAG: glutamate-5-semialdehyde dehydrogenase [Spirochaetales bacterium]